MKIALVAHNNKKKEILSIVNKYNDLLSQCTLFSTRQTGEVIEDRYNVNVNKVKSGPTGGDIEIANYATACAILDSLNKHLD